MVRKLFYPEFTDVSLELYIQFSAPEVHLTLGISGGFGFSLSSVAVSIILFPKCFDPFSYLRNVCLTFDF